MKEVTFLDSKGNHILGTLSIPKQSTSIVIMSHGFTSSKESKLYVEMQNELNKINIGTFRFNYYGHGPVYCKNIKYTVTNDVTLSKCLESLKSTIAFIRSLGNYNIGLVGKSFGGLISIIVASQEPLIKNLILISSVTEPIKFWRNRLDDEKIKKWKQKGYLHYNEYGENYELNYSFWEDLLTYNVYKMARTIVCPVLIIHGDSDFVVPIKQSYDFAKVMNTNIRIIKFADHQYSNLKNYSEMKKLTIDFLKKQLSNRTVNSKTFNQLQS